MLSSGLLTLERSGAGNFFHAYSDTQTIGLHTDSNTSQLWKLGLKANPTDDTAAPTVGYVFGKDGQVGVVSNANNYVTLTDDIGLAIYNNSHTILNASSATGVTVEGSVAAQPVLTVQSPAAASEDIQKVSTCIRMKMAK